MSNIGNIISLIQPGAASQGTGSVSTDAAATGEQSGLDSIFALLLNNGATPSLSVGQLALQSSAQNGASTTLSQQNTLSGIVASSSANQGGSVGKLSALNTLLSSSEQNTDSSTLLTTSLTSGTSTSSDPVAALSALKQQSATNGSALPTSQDEDALDPELLALLSSAKNISKPSAVATQQENAQATAQAEAQAQAKNAQTSEVVDSVINANVTGAPVRPEWKAQQNRSTADSTTTSATATASQKSTADAFNPSLNDTLMNLKPNQQMMNTRDILNNVALKESLQNGQGSSSANSATDEISAVKLTDISSQSSYAKIGEYTKFSELTNKASNDQRAMSAHVADQIAVSMSKALAKGEQQIRVQLHPAELGEIDIQMRVAKDGTTHVSMQVQRQETLDMLQRDTRALEQSLADSGLQTDMGSLSFSLRQQDKDGNSQFSDSLFQSHTGDHDEDALEEYSPIFTRRYHVSSGLDMRV